MGTREVGVAAPGIIVDILVANPRKALNTIPNTCLVGNGD